MSHGDSDIVSSLLSGIDSEYGKISNMTTTRVKMHRYPGVTIDYSSTGKLILSVVNYMGKVLNDTPEDMKGVSATPAARHLFYIAEDATKLSRTNADLFLPLCGAAGVPVKASTPRHTSGSLVIMN